MFRKPKPNLKTVQFYDSKFIIQIIMQHGYTP